jgi:hypothetical protein
MKVDILCNCHVSPKDDGYIYCIFNIKCSFLKIRWHPRTFPLYCGRLVFRMCARPDVVICVCVCVCVYIYIYIYILSTVIFESFLYGAVHFGTVIYIQGAAFNVNHFESRTTHLLYTPINTTEHGQVSQCL